MKYKSTALILALLLSLVLSSGCGAVQYGSSASTSAAMTAVDAVNGIKMTLSGTPTSLILQRADSIILMWPFRGQYAYTIISATGEFTSMTKPDVSGAFDMTDFILTMEGRGWQAIAPAAVPPAIVKVFSAYSVEAVMNGLEILPTIFLIPLSILPTPQQDTNG